MKEALAKLVAEMRAMLVGAGVGARSVDGLLRDGLDHVAIYDSAMGVFKHEHRRCAEVWLLQPASTWAYYEARGVDDLREVKMLVAARRQLRHAWRSRVAVYLKKEERDGRAGEASAADLGSQTVEDGSQGTPGAERGGPPQAG